MLLLARQYGFLRLLGQALDFLALLLRDVAFSHRRNWRLRVAWNYRHAARHVGIDVRVGGHGRCVRFRFRGRVGDGRVVPEVVLYGRNLGGVRGSCRSCVSPLRLRHLRVRLGLVGQIGDVIRGGVVRHIRLDARTWRWHEGCVGLWGSRWRLKGCLRVDQVEVRWHGYFLSEVVC